MQQELDIEKRKSRGEDRLSWDIGLKSNVFISMENIDFWRGKWKHKQVEERRVESNYEQSEVNREERTQEGYI